MVARDIMRRRVVTVSPRTTLKEAADLFAERRITGAPVVTDEGRLVGVISQTDLLNNREDLVSKEVPIYHRQAEEYLAPPTPGVHDARVEQAMTPWVISFEEDTPVRELAEQMLHKRIHRVIITKDGELSGIVTSMDLIKALLALGKERKKKTVTPASTVGRGPTDRL